MKIIKISLAGYLRANGIYDFQTTPPHHSLSQLPKIIAFEGYEEKKYELIDGSFAICGHNDFFNVDYEPIKTNTEPEIMPMWCLAGFDAELKKRKSFPKQKELAGLTFELELIENSIGIYC